ncbi:hypothetical protein LSTR_LSTR002081 [Laodelphax striatellus]|uniref:Uncharacterized protein n=1 Tax=Laodelphax striatellus TaxID=195883 RepID=A0A482XPE9_LAOST|nr:hypothetical protein LSTR_LSTR002081 [Laodelphax striatellus]
MIALQGCQQSYHSWQQSSTRVASMSTICITRAILCNDCKQTVLTCRTAIGGGNKGDQLTGMHFAADDHTPTRMRAHTTNNNKTQADDQCDSTSHTLLPYLSTTTTTTTSNDNDETNTPPSSAHPSTPQHPSPAQVAEQRLHEVEEDDWLIVDKNEVQDENEEPVVRGRTVERRSSSAGPGAGAGMEESWFVTPPPCFTSAGPVTPLETSPLENLLIEHPSMSVYHGQPASAASQLRPRSRSASPTPRQPLQPVAANRPRQQPPAAAAVYHNSTDLIVHLKSAQKQQRKSGQQLKRGQLERTNKVREFSSRNKQQRRADRQANHSGANNNRKSC